MKNFMRLSVALVSILLLSSALGADRVVLAPLAAVKKELMHVVTVSAQDGDFSDPVAAVNSITDAAAANPYLVLIGPGVYTLTQTLVMKPFVTVAGSGREATTLTGAISTFSYDASSAIVSGADDGVLCDLAVENTGGSGVSIALYNNSASPVVQNVSATATGGTFNYGVYNEYSSVPTLTEVTTKASGGNYNYGVFNSSSPR